ncbi:SAM-dependent methyltransferase [Oleiagrimonas soli]|uniref:SAM-dependent methyltransferase n=1 Tax=Oleiagrimonas soli TaxID=1543381 RepID=A0A099CVQ2_9GAMM|nr:class I SAM-dependent methyltransferase [Oleiagrimonas soli]KGI77100.1 SAM-dependent methyltransferase [Oleiagrimonas soli]MBB6185364.1 SAM-dependent methyltransferase [Oleiagrimonas soli]
MVDWDERYAGDDYLFGTAPSAFMVAQQARLPAQGMALAVADGDGRNGVWLAEQGLDVLAVDGSQVGLDKSRRLADARGVQLRYELADLADWDFGHERFDVIAGIFIQFADPAFRARMFADMQRALKPGGLLLLQGYRPEQLAYGTGGPSEAENMYTEPMLREAFSGLQIEHLASYDAELHEGRHEGMSALIDLVARKPAAACA